MTPDNMTDAILRGKVDKTLARLYSDDAVQDQRGRYADAVKRFSDFFGKERDIRIFTAPGRTEIGGNHTDHQHGRVLAAAVNLDVLCVASPNNDGKIRVRSIGYPIEEIDITDLKLREKEKGKSVALIRGVASACAERGYKVSGFDCFTTSEVLKGSGLSSSASFEVAVGTMISKLFNDGAISSVEIAQIGQYAENTYFGKPSGLMDQMASSVGGLIAIDFANADDPVILPVDFDFGSCGYTLCIVDTKGSHSNLTPDYAAIPEEMLSVARCLGKPYLSLASEEEFFDNIPAIRKKCGDRAVMRAIHFFGDNLRVLQEIEALKQGEFAGFLRHVNESGRSSALNLQNIFSCANPHEQGLSIALVLCERILGDNGAWRVHGGGFAGTIQAFVPDESLVEFVSTLDAVFGQGACHKLMIRPVGGTEIIPD